MLGRYCPSSRLFDLNKGRVNHKAKRTRKKMRYIPLNSLTPQEERIWARSLVGSRVSALIDHGDGVPSACGANKEEITVLPWTPVAPMTRMSFLTDISNGCPRYHLQAIFIPFGDRSMQIIRLALKRNLWYGTARKQHAPHNVSKY